MSKITGTGANDLSAEVPEIEPNELVLKNKIGGGQFGDVFIGTCRGKTVAIKKLHAKQFEAKMLEEFKKEVAILTCAPCLSWFMSSLSSNVNIKTFASPKCGTFYGRVHDAWAPGYRHRIHAQR